MKVIAAGFPKTGTKSLNAALTALGYNVYDFLENSILLQEDYKKIFNEGWTTGDFKRMYEDVDAVTDGPAFYFWEEIHKAFPDAKIILSLRENDEVWFNSFKKQFHAQDTNVAVRLIELLSPTYRRIAKHIASPLLLVSYGLPEYSPFRIKMHLNKEMMKLKYRAHNAYVLENAPSDKLLVFHCKEGWEPLCKFLGVPVPDQPFPHKNVRGNILEELLEKNPFVQKMKRELLISSAVLIAVLGVSSYYMYTVGPCGIYNVVCNSFSNILNNFFSRQ